MNLRINSTIATSPNISISKGIQSRDSGNNIDTKNDNNNLLLTETAENSFKDRINYLEVTSENLVPLESRIKDIDMAKEIMNFTKNQIVMHAGMSMFLQANLIPYRVIQLLSSDTSTQYKIKPIKKI